MMDVTREDTAATAQEQTLREVGEVMLTLERASARAPGRSRRLLTVLVDRPEAQNQRVALQRAVGDLEAVRRRLAQNGYLAGRQQRLV